MNPRALVVLFVALTGCGVPPVAMPVPEPVPQPVADLVVPAELAAQGAVSIYAQLDGGAAVFASEQSYVLGDGYPSQVTLAPTGLVYVAAAGCSYAVPPTAHWYTLSEVTGDAATLVLDGGTLTVSLQHEGTVTALLEGELIGARCEVGGVTRGTYPLRHRLTLRVHRVASFVVEHTHQLWPGCNGATLVAPAGIELSFPRVHPVDVAGVELRAANAPRPVALRLRSPADSLVGTDTGWRFTAEKGKVEVVVDTTLPVRGLQAFELVAPSSLSSLEASLQLTRTASKGSVSLPIEDGKSYRVFFPDEPNTVDVKVGAVVTALGPLCAPVPAAWFAATTSTPGQCVTPVRGMAASSAWTPVASIVSAGECRVEVTVPGTAHRWAASFSTTR